MTLRWFCSRVGTAAGAFSVGCSERPGKFGVLFRLPAGMVKLMLHQTALGQTCEQLCGTRAAHGARYTGGTEAEEQILWSPP